MYITALYRLYNLAFWLQFPINLLTYLHANVISLSVMVCETVTKRMPTVQNVTPQCYTAYRIICYSRIGIPQKLNRYSIFNNRYRYWGFDVGIPFTEKI